MQSLRKAAADSIPNAYDAEKELTDKTKAGILKAVEELKVIM